MKFSLPIPLTKGYLEFTMWLSIEITSADQVADCFLVLTDHALQHQQYIPGPLSSAPLGTLAAHCLIPDHSALAHTLFFFLI